MFCFAHTHSHIHTCIRIYTHIQTHTCKHTCTHTHTHTLTNTYTHTYHHTQTHPHIHTFTGSALPLILFFPFHYRVMNVGAVCGRWIYWLPHEPIHHMLASSLHFLFLTWCFFSLLNIFSVMWLFVQYIQSRRSLGMSNMWAISRTKLISTEKQYQNPYSG